MAGYARGMGNKTRSKGSNGSRGSSGSVTYLPKAEYSIPLSDQRTWFNKYSKAYEDFEQEERARLLKNKQKGEDYVRINLVEVPLSDGVYQTICPSADNGLMKVTVGENKMVEYEIIRRPIEKKPLQVIEAFIEAEKAKKVELEELKKKAVTMDEQQVEELAKNISLNKTALQRFVEPTRFWKYVEPEVIEEKKRKTENILLSLKYYKQAPGIGFMPEINYYRNYPPAKNGIAQLKFKSFEGDDRIPSFEQTYVDENGVEKKESALVYHEPIWTRNMMLAKMYKSASTIGGRRKRRTKKRSPK